MSYDHTKQYRCPIVRGKSQSDMENLLPLYASLISKITPCDRDSFAKQFNDMLRPHLESPSIKTLNNHRTEIAGKLFGLYFERDEKIYISERAQKLLGDSDLPAFFKDICAKMQFPSGANKIETAAEQLRDSVSIRQFSYLLRFLKIKPAAQGPATKDDIGYYILNALDVLTRRATPEEVWSQIAIDRTAGIHRRVETGAADSFDRQHINEQINLLELANLIYIEEDEISLNTRETESIEKIASFWNSAPEFDFASFDLSTPSGRHAAESDWDIYFGSLWKEKVGGFATAAEALQPANVEELPPETTPVPAPSFETGEAGEIYVFNYEKERIRLAHSRLVNRVKRVGFIKGLGYDVHSVRATGENPDFATYIEVKSTKRITEPSSDYEDYVILTRNEWLAAEQYGADYFIYRVYFYRGETKILILANPKQLERDRKIFVTPMDYRLDFNQDTGYYA